MHLDNCLQLDNCQLYKVIVSHFIKIPIMILHIGLASAQSLVACYWVRLFNWAGLVLGGACIGGQRGRGGLQCTMQLELFARKHLDGLCSVPQ